MASRQKRKTVSLETSTLTVPRSSLMVSYDALLVRSSSIHVLKGIICANFLGNFGSYVRASSAKRAFVSSDGVAAFILDRSDIVRMCFVGKSGKARK